MPALAEALPQVQLIGDSLMRCTTPAAGGRLGQRPPVLASDVAFTLKLMFCPGLPNEALRSVFVLLRTFDYDPASPRRFTLVCAGQSLEFARAVGRFSYFAGSALDPRGQLRRFRLADTAAPPATAPADTALLALARRYRAATQAGAGNLLPGCGPYRAGEMGKRPVPHFPA